MKALAAAVLLVPLSAGAQMYKCVDERGVVQYTDTAGARCKVVDIRPSPLISGDAKPRPSPPSRRPTSSDAAATPGDASRCPEPLARS